MNRRHFLRTLSTAASSAYVSMSSPMALGAGAEKYRVALIGHTGRGNFGHGLDAMWLTVPRASIVGVADMAAKADALELNARRFPEAKCFPEYRHMLAEVRPDVVAICPRHVDQHAEMVQAAVEAGARGIYMEKPFVRTLLEADEVARVCREKGVRLAVAHRNRYHPVLPVISEMLAAGRFGRLLEMRARGKEDKRGGGLDLWVLGSHVLNLGTVFGGRPLACSAGVFQNGKPATREDVVNGDEGIGLILGNSVHARFETESGVPLFFDSVQNAGSSSAGFGIQLICSEAVVDLRIDVEPLAHVLWGNPFLPRASASARDIITSAGVGVPEPLSDIRRMVAGHGYPAEDLLNAIEQKREPLCGIEEARTTVEMISAVFESHRLGGKRVALPLETRVNPLTLF